MADSEEKELHKVPEEHPDDQVHKDGKTEKKDGRKKGPSSGWSKIKKAVDARIDSAAQKEKTAEEKESLENQFLRLRADFDNFRKRTVKDRNELYFRANEEILEALLPVLDHLDLAISAAEEHNAGDAFVQGIKIVSEQMSGVLAKFGLRPIETRGLEFNHNEHEAISYLSSADVPRNVVMAQVRRGYFLGDKLLRAAQVIVSSGNAAETAGNPAEGNGGI